MGRKRFVGLFYRVVGLDTGIVSGFKIMAICWLAFTLVWLCEADADVLLTTYTATFAAHLTYSAVQFCR